MLDLAIFPEQQRFIAVFIPIAAIMLIKAYIRPAGLIWILYAFYADTDQV
jgi:diamine N-acetyltransferase